MSHRATWNARYAGPRTPVPPTELLTAHRGLLPRSGYALDVACGDGRHALWLARLGLTVDAIDFSRNGLEKLAAAARRERLAVRAVQADLERFHLLPDRYAMVVHTRYLQRSLMPSLRQTLRPGGLIAFETFLREQARIGHPRNPDYLLEAGELRTYFSGFEVLVDEEGLFETVTGRAYLARLLARRPRRDPLD